jgi:DNA uptake protein ComE-like DNA-binding protein
MNTMPTLTTLLVTFALAATAAAQAPATAKGFVDPNAATEQELLALPHVTPAVAKAIVGGRPFKSMGPLDALLSKSLKREQLAELYEKLFIPVDLNTASDADILSIPGVGKRMLHEFKEYRPYKVMAQFRKEIGKYVDDKEVARLERYVTIK